MLQRQGFPPGVPAWIDRLVPDPEAASSFYAELFGWTLEDLAPDGGGARYLVARLDGRLAAAIGAPRDGHASDGWNTYVATDDIDAAMLRVREAGGTLVAGPSDLGGAARVAACRDPGGAAFGLWHPRDVLGAEVVNAPGAWNFSELRTDDVVGAARFYGAVFGWEVDEVDMGGGPASMVRLPGYADFLEQFDPGLRQRHADFGAPSGFSECVAWILPLEPGEPTHWSVTFTVADADAIAAAARDLGGTVLQEPADLGPAVRGTVVADPFGARFAANAFNPG